MANLQSLMSKDVVTIDANQTVQEAAQMMSQYNIGSIPVMQNGKVAGMVTDRDITLRNTAQGAADNTPVSQVMTSSNIVTGAPNMDVNEAANLMSQNQIRRLPVVENGQVVGMVALGDLATQNQYDDEAEQALTNISTPSRPQK